jgi:hypothetical protein
MNLCDIATVTHGLKDFCPIKLTFTSKQELLTWQKQWRGMIIGWQFKTSELYAKHFRRAQNIWFKWCLH